MRVVFFIKSNEIPCGRFTTCLRRVFGQALGPCQSHPTLRLIRALLSSAARCPFSPSLFSFFFPNHVSIFFPPVDERVFYSFIDCITATLQKERVRDLNLVRNLTPGPGLQLFHKHLWSLVIWSLLLYYLYSHPQCCSRLCARMIRKQLISHAYFAPALFRLNLS